MAIQVFSKLIREVCLRHVQVLLLVPRFFASLSLVLVQIHFFVERIVKVFLPLIVQVLHVHFGRVVAAIRPEARLIFILFVTGLHFYLSN